MNPPSDVSVQIRALRLWHYLRCHSNSKESARLNNLAYEEPNIAVGSRLLHQGDIHGEAASVHARAVRILDGLFPPGDVAHRDETKFSFDGKNIPVPIPDATFTAHLDKVRIPPLHLALNAGLDNVIDQLQAMKRVIG